MGEGARDRRPRVLLVDDDPSFAASLSLVLDDEFDLALATTARAARTLLVQAAFQVVVTDYELPSESGLTLVAWMRESIPAVPAILISGHRENPQVAAARHGGALFRVLLKPFEPDALVTAVRSAASFARMRASMNGLRGVR